jgi:protein phosphatase
MTQGSRKFDCGAATDVGKVRLENEDSFLVDADRGVFAVADGMGGHQAGAFASATVVEALRLANEPANVTRLLAQSQERLAEANRRLIEVAGQRGGQVIGATIAALLAWEGYYACIWSGDSRIYLIRQGRIQQISRDHTEVAELVAEGVLSEAEAKTWPRRNVITRAVGVRRELELDVTQGVLEKGDIFIICSDGLTAHVDDAEILDTMLSHAPQIACDKLVALANQRGGIDNVTVVAARYAPRGSTIIFPQSAAPGGRSEAR